MATKKVALLVDFAKHFMKSQESFLQRSGVEVFSPTCGKEALSFIQNEEPDLVFLDYDLDGMTGAEVCREIKQDRRLQHIPIVMVTFGGNRAEVKRSEEAGCDDWISSPLDDEILLEKTSELLGLPLRRHVRFLIEVDFRGRRNETMFFGHSVDVSENGMLIETAGQLEVGEEVGLRLYPPNVDREIEMEACVVREVQGEPLNQYGVEFLELTDESQEQVDQLVELHAVGKLQSQHG